MRVQVPPPAPHFARQYFGTQTRGTNPQVPIELEGLCFTSTVIVASSAAISEEPEDKHTDSDPSQQAAPFARTLQGGIDSDLQLSSYRAWSARTVRTPKTPRISFPPVAWKRTVIVVFPSISSAGIA